MPTVTLRLPENHYRLFKKLAEGENRSLSNFIETATIRHIEESEYADHCEMEEIGKNADLNSSMSKGHTDARLKGADLSTDQFYRIFETNEFIKRVSKLIQQDALFIQNKLTTYVYPQLKSEPHFGNNIKKLTGYKPETWRYRIGKFRLFFSIDDASKTVNILTIEFRKDAY